MVQAKVQIVGCLSISTNWRFTFQTQLLNKFSTCRGELKKLVKILIRSYPHFIPSREEHFQALKNKSTPKICLITARLEKKCSKLEYDPNHVHILVTGLSEFNFLNNPPTPSMSSILSCSWHTPMIQQGNLLANLILEALCKSFYEEEKWQRLLLLHTDEVDDEWITSVPITMVTLATTAISNSISKTNILLTFESIVPKCTWRVADQPLHQEAVQSWKVFKNILHNPRVCHRLSRTWPACIGHARPPQFLGWRIVCWPLLLFYINYRLYL